jgi:hypothetical protein
MRWYRSALGFGTGNGSLPGSGASTRQVSGMSFRGGNAKSGEREAATRAKGE